MGISRIQKRLLSALASGINARVFLFPLVLGSKEREGHMEPFEPSLFLQVAASSSVRCAWLTDLPACAGQACDELCFPFGPEGWVRTVSPVDPESQVPSVCRPEPVLLFELVSSQKQDVVRGASHPHSLPFALFLFCFLILTLL